MKNRLAPKSMTLTFV